ncbi:MAG: hypothetical protein KBT44_07640 [Bacteroidales bacterium]|nr:hypothetical protein [Candidatus Equibacterium intestinale]
MRCGTALAAAACLFILAGCAPKGPADAGAGQSSVPVIHITDLTRPHGDPDDHWDAATQFALNKKGLIDLRAVITDNLPALGAPDLEGIAQLNWITGAGVPVGVGETTYNDSAHSGLALLRKTLEESDSPVAIHVVGGCLDLAAAAKMWPDLFKEKVKAVYLNAGSAEESQTLEYNVALHPQEYSEMFSLPCPLYWMPCLQNTDEWCAKGGVPGVNSTYFRFTQGRLFKEMRQDLLNYFLFALTKGEAGGWLEALSAPYDSEVTDFYGGQVRNMWCTAGFLHCAGLSVWKDGSVQPLGRDSGEEVFRFVPVEVSCSPEGRVTWSRTDKDCGRFIFEVTDLEAYEEAMTKALGEAMSWM